ncbi:MAG: pyridoxal 5'-phosphate synthase glutaminase subunit PdxT [Bryobacteraceae bacterium]
MKRVGILALQGDFERHQKSVESAGGAVFLVRKQEDLVGLDGLIIPGGESTTMLKLLDDENLFDSVRAFGRVLPVFGTCAGAILMATEVLNPHQKSLGLMDLTVERNAYGRQVDSHITHITPDATFADGGAGDFECVFIRAPIIRRAGNGTKVLAVADGFPVLVEQGRHLAATYHPELTPDLRVHKRFLSKL